MSSSKKLANYLIRALRGDLAQFRGWKMKIWPKIQAKMALTQLSPIAGYYHGVLADTVIVIAAYKKATLRSEKMK